MTQSNSKDYKDYVAYQTFREEDHEPVGHKVPKHEPDTVKQVNSEEQPVPRSSAHVPSKEHLRDNLYNQERLHFLQSRGEQLNNNQDEINVSHPTDANEEQQPASSSDIDYLMKFFPDCREVYEVDANGNILGVTSRMNMINRKDIKYALYAHEYFLSHGSVKSDVRAGELAGKLRGIKPSVSLMELCKQKTRKWLK